MKSKMIIASTFSSRVASAAQGLLGTEFIVDAAHDALPLASCPASGLEVSVVAILDKDSQTWTPMGCEEFVETFGMDYYLSLPRLVVRPNIRAVIGEHLKRWKFPSQDSTRSQLDRVWARCLELGVASPRHAWHLANAMGEYDAADVIRGWIEYGAV